ncbi:dienelactone hydrolase family protein [Anaerotignum neopropionicum]|uniref:Dienelactone hydrolase family protein n=1 Tax=Anaerotignum neopropionicum TaxID=36847 RepID=A0A136WED0_9FIRM|nr:dienelactone hydrolase family protein [Anaerotignum neopropionicum]KXL52854.1 dienelactone hydrolase family protein [Anaerotignum neopropionicum]
MLQKISNHKTAIILLHEIYGINQFIETMSAKLNLQGFDVFCPNMLGRECFDYTQSHEAYEFFKKNVGFDYWKKVMVLSARLKLAYEKVYFIGFSVGATIAWRCCEGDSCDGIICCYGSRIRDYLSLRPSCPTLLLFAHEDSFDVEHVVKKLSDKPNIETFQFQASHGFMDQYTASYHQKHAKKAETYIRGFLK